MARRKKKQKLGGDALREKVRDRELCETLVGPERKHTIRKMIRDAIRRQNRQVLFTCRDCCFYLPPGEKIGRTSNCRMGNGKLALDKRMPTQLPECFTYDPLASPFADVLTLMYALGVDTINAEHGWATIVGRLAARQDRYGYMSGVTQKNLERYGS